MCEIEPRRAEEFGRSGAFTRRNEAKRVAQSLNPARCARASREVQFCLIDHRFMMWSRTSGQCRSAVHLGPFTGRTADLELSAFPDNFHDFVEYIAMPLPFTGDFHAESMHSVQYKNPNFLKVSDRAHTLLSWVPTGKQARAAN